MSDRLPEGKPRAGGALPVHVGPGWKKPVFPSPRPMVWGVEMELQMCLTGRPLRLWGWNGAELFLDFSPGRRGRPWRREDWEWHRTKNGARWYYESPTLPEVSTAECRHVLDLVANVQAQLELVARRLRQINALLEGGTLEARLAATDQGGHSFGQHYNFRLPQPLIDGWLDRRPHYLQRALIPHLVSGIILWGTGKAGSENGAPEAVWQLSQRADFVEQPGVSFQTTCRRGFVADRRDLPERLMLLSFDGNRLDRALALAMGTTGLVLALMAAEAGLPDLILRDPAEALQAASRDLSLQAPVLVLENGQRLSALEMQEILCQRCRAFIEAGAGGPVEVAGAAWVLDRWEETLHRLRHDRESLAGSLDWVAKWSLLEEAGIPLDSEEARRFDLEWARLDRDGPIALLRQEGDLEVLVPREQIDDYRLQAPRDTRAWLRAAALQKFGPEILVPDWDKLRTLTGWELDLDDVTGFTAAEVQGIVERAASATELLQDLGALPARWGRSFSSCPPQGNPDYSQIYPERRCSDDHAGKDLPSGFLGRAGTSPRKPDPSGPSETGGTNAGGLSERDGGGGLGIPGKA